MTWILLVAPLAGITMLTAVLWICRWLMPLRRVAAAPEPKSASVDYNALVQKTALILGKGVIAIMRDSLDKLTAPRGLAAQDMSSEFPQFAKPTSMTFEGSLEVDLGNIGSPEPPTDEPAKVARRTISPRSP